MLWGARFGVNGRLTLSAGGSVDLRNKFTIREHRACPQFVASFPSGLFGVLFPEARDLPPRRSKILGAIFQQPAKLRLT
jgi:hypothetical protein